MSNGIEDCYLLTSIPMDKYILLGNYNDVTNRIFKVIRKVANNKIHALYDLLRDNIEIFPLILGFTIASQPDIKTLLDFNMLLNVDNKEVTKDQIKALIDNSFAYIAKNSIGITDGKIFKKKVIYDAYVKYKDYIADKLTKLDQEYNVYREIMRALFNNYPNITNMQLYLPMSKLINEEHVLIDSTLNVLDLCGNYERFIAVDERKFIVKYIQSVYDLYTYSCYDSREIDRRANKKHNRSVISMIDEYYKDGIDLILRFFSNWKYIRANVNDKESLLMLVKKYDDNLYFRIINDEYPFTIIDYNEVMNTKVILTNAFNKRTSEYMALVNSKSYYNQEDLKNTIVQDDSIIRAILSLIANTNVFNNHIFHIFNLIYNSDNSISILKFKDITKQIRPMVSQLLFPIYYHIYNIIINVLTNIKTDTKIELYNIMLVSINNNAFIDDNKDIAAIITMVYTDNNDKIIDVIRFLVSTNKDFKHKILILNSNKHSTQDEIISYCVKDSNKLSVINSARNFSKNKYLRFINEDDCSSIVVQIANQLHIQFTTTLKSLIAQFLEDHKLLNSRIMNRYPMITYNGNLQDFLIEFKYSFEMDNEVIDNELLQDSRVINHTL